MVGSRLQPSACDDDGTAAERTCMYTGWSEGKRTKLQLHTHIYIYIYIHKQTQPLLYVTCFPVRSGANASLLPQSVTCGVLWEKRGSLETESMGLALGSYSTNQSVLGFGAVDTRNPISNPKLEIKKNIFISTFTGTKLRKSLSLKPHIKPLRDKVVRIL